ncbi:hypothetical protein CCUS01_05527 [Colletotrichum cuscutae]|uniref:Uncharacterized protein n=3 Tax=Colletotrichum acutatum species complex TaxID=2707335 RepID=A0AAJ0E4I7_9PEZI|nr:uncharacterized protein CCOS01_04996 [Colletotrichum costaricense]XP_060386538.1 uncharacterized protein CTAM01_02697 [Colletotrichum tamarilloi]KAI3549387.1 hypothetical protein CSPX01_02495 [Colletotrichum filicis]KAK1473937.1 hypothetical protein CCUS01_05527 [Colletotrichum cuscutae]KAK1507585.1 hypothetical protein CTAM01_02697 [Colletotrichum tamarilloi]KAK1533013.1 hypothetical protein CCOS01_04996 [Colletotrichum costaricense]
MTPDEDPENKFISSGRFFCQSLPPSHHAQIRETAKPSCSPPFTISNSPLTSGSHHRSLPHPEEPRSDQFPIRQFVA